MNDFIKSQQELADALHRNRTDRPSRKEIHALVTQIIQNTGEELMRGVEDINISTTIGFIKPEDQKGYRQAQTDIKKHITQLTGVE